MAPEVLSTLVLVLCTMGVSVVPLIEKQDIGGGIGTNFRRLISIYGTLKILAALYSTASEFRSGEEASAAGTEEYSVIWWVCELAAACLGPLASIQMAWLLHHRLKQYASGRGLTTVEYWFNAVVFIDCVGAVRNSYVGKLWHERSGLGWFFLFVSYGISAVPTMQTLEHYRILCVEGRSVAIDTLRLIERVAMFASFLSAVGCVDSSLLGETTTHLVIWHICAPLLWIRLLVHGFFANLVDEALPSSPRRRRGSGELSDAEEGPFTPSYTFSMPVLRL